MKHGNKFKYECKECGEKTYYMTQADGRTCNEPGCFGEMIPIEVI